MPLGNAADESATRCRGHGHCPYWARLFSSMSTTATRAESLGARPHSFYQVEAAHAQFGDDAGVDDAQYQGARDQRECSRAAGTAQQSDAPVSGGARHNSSSSPS